MQRIKRFECSSAHSRTVQECARSFTERFGRNKGGVRGDLGSSSQLAVKGQAFVYFKTVPTIVLSWRSSLEPVDCRGPRHQILNCRIRVAFPLQIGSTQVQTRGATTSPFVGTLPMRRSARLRWNGWRRCVAQPKLFGHRSTTTALTCRRAFLKSSPVSIPVSTDWPQKEWIESFCFASLAGQNF